MPQPKVIDISHWQTAVSFDEVAASGILGVIAKATEGQEYADPTYAERRKEAEGCGLLWGAYHFLRPGDMQAQADRFLSVAQPDETILLAADHEDVGVSLDDLKAFLTAVRELSGHVPVLYSGSVIKQQLGDLRDAELAQYPLWLAQYGDRPTWPDATWPSWFLWQYTGTGSCDGIEGDVDLSCYEGAEDLMLAWSGLVPEPMPAEQVVAIDITAPSGVVVALTINGQAR